MSQAQPVSRETLLAIANNMLTEHQSYFPGVNASDVEQREDVLIFRGNYFLDDRGLPGPESTVVFNLFKWLAVELSPRYRLAE